jgi:hypothetical protein
MMNFRLLGAIALSLALATPAMADSDFGMHRRHHDYHRWRLRFKRLL